MQIFEGNSRTVYKKNREDKKRELKEREQEKQREQI
jgi:hypothetical protein